MEAMKLKFFVALMVVLMAISSVQKAAAIFVPTFFASLVALAFGLVF
ncbi:arabinogalactan protein 13 [Quercus suber]|nr:arabinogalactan peptide 13-like [Quercus suber]